MDIVAESSYIDLMRRFARVHPFIVQGALCMQGKVTGASRCSDSSVWFWQIFKGWSAMPMSASRLCFLLLYTGRFPNPTSFAIVRFRKLRYTAYVMKPCSSGSTPHPQGDDRCAACMLSWCCQKCSHSSR